MAEFEATVIVESPDAYIRSCVKEIARDLVEKVLNDAGIKSFNDIWDDPEFSPPYARISGRVFTNDPVDPEKHGLIEKEFEFEGGVARVTLMLRYA